MVKLKTASAAGEKLPMAFVPAAKKLLKRHDKVIHKGRYKSYKGTFTVCFVIHQQAFPGKH